MKIANRWGLIAATVLAAFGGMASASTPCQQSIYAVDPASADTLALGIFGETCGEVVPVSDVLVQSVSFYGPPGVAGLDRGTLWITTVDATGKPQTYSIVYGGTTVVLAAGDGVAPSHYDFTFDPPLALPAIGAYDFALKGDCSPVAVLAIKTAANAGHEWGTGRLCGPGLGSLSYGPLDPSMDLAMRIVFCASGATPATGSTWGRVKSIYR